VRILLCDDTAEMRALLRSALEARADVTIVGEAGDGERALERAAADQPDIVVVDLEMPGPPAPALLAGLRAAAPATKIVTFSGHDPSAVAGGAIREIALHLPKTTDLDAAVDAICALGRNHSDGG
jgi:DNA-binding NarL/FixJ family response regulator